MRLLQALTFPERRTAALHLPAHPSPFPASGKGVGGKGKCCRRLPWERFCAQYGLIFGSRRKSIRIQHSQRQGSWGSATSVFCFGAPDGSQDPVGKGGAAERWRVAPCASGATRHGAQPATTRTNKSQPRRVGVQIIIFCKTCPAEGARSLCHVHPPTGKETIPKIKRAARRNHSFFACCFGVTAPANPPHLP